MLGVVTFGQTKNTTIENRPKLMVGIMVDQMRWDYLYRFEKHFSEGGLKRMMKDGYAFHNVMIDYVPTVTAIGHASVYTGSVPSIHGIAGNDWIDRETGKSRYVTTDTSVKGVGASSEKIGAHSPRSLWSTTITDQLGIATGFKSKIVGVSLKDRASILPAGHNPLGAFWFDEGTGNFITSSYYMDSLPNWLVDFNNAKVGEKLVSQGWNTIKPISEYTESTRDDVPWEGLIGSATKPTFPYANLKNDYQKNKGVIRTTPFGNTLTLSAAQAAIDGYKMGDDDITDFLVINLASTDYVGHTFGVNSIEVEDTYIRMDRDLEQFFNYLDKKIGKGNYTVFLTADHGAAHSVGYMQENKMATGYFAEGWEKELPIAIEKEFGASNLLLGVDNYQIYLDHRAIEDKGLELEAVKDFVLKYAKSQKDVLYAIDLNDIGDSPVPSLIKERVINGYNWQRSGDIQLVSLDGMLPSYAKKGTTHSVWNSYDAHIPLLFMGKGIKHGSSVKPYHMSDIASTVAQLLKIENPSGSIGNPIVEIME